MKEYKAIVTYEIDDGKGVCHRDYIITAANEDNAELRALARWNMDVMANSLYKAIYLDIVVL